MKLFLSCSGKLVLLFLWCGSRGGLPCCEARGSIMSTMEEVSLAETTNLDRSRDLAKVAVCQKALLGDVFRTQERRRITWRLMTTIGIWRGAIGACEDVCPCGLLGECSNVLPDGQYSCQCDDFADFDSETCLVDLTSITDFCRGIRGGGQNKDCYTDRGMPLCSEDVVEDCWPNSVPCADFGTFNDQYGICGVDRQGGSRCKIECCGAQQEYCEGAFGCRLNLVFEGCMIGCMDDRGCDYEVDIEAVLEHCRGIQGGGQNTECYTSRGIPLCSGQIATNCWPNVVPCEDFGNFDSAYGNCGVDSQGGSRCESQCCDVQESYCNTACALDPIRETCMNNCLSDRGCSYEVNIGAVLEHCRTNGGGQNSACYTDRLIPVCSGSVTTNCWPNVVPCSHFGNYNTALYGNCGVTRQGGSRCKNTCCGFQETFCNGACVLNGCKNQCLEDRNCPRTFRRLGTGTGGTM